MVVIGLIFVIGLTPAIVSAWLSVRADQAEKSSDTSAMATGLSQGMLKLIDGNTDMHFIEGLGYMMGDITCEQNARSPYLRCAVNPMGPCDGCSSYAPKVFDRQV